MRLNRKTIRNSAIGFATAAALAIPVALPAALPAAEASPVVGTTAVKEGQDGNGVKAVQHLLNASGADVEVDGKFGSETRAAVVAFQEDNGLDADGIVGPETIAELAPTVRSGDDGEAVKAAQAAVGADVDGKFGPNTEAKVKEFQESQGISADGIVGPQTWGKVVGGESGGGGGGSNRPGEGGTFDGTTLSDEQDSNARVIMSVAKGHDLNKDAQIIGVMTAMQESTLKNLNYGDRDSQGLFQQRPGVGWGTVAEITDPVKSSQAFYGVADHTDNPGLVDIDGWESMSKTEAAQAVQVSAYPDAYAKWEQMATEVVEANDDVEPQK